MLSTFLWILGIALISVLTSGKMRSVFDGVCTGSDRVGLTTERLGIVFDLVLWLK